MADERSFPVVALTFIVGVVVIVLVYVTKLVESVVKETKPEDQPSFKQTEVVKKQTKQGGSKKKHVEKKSWEPRQNSNFTHPWLLTSLKGHTGHVLDMDISPNGKYLATCAQVKPPDIPPPLPPAQPRYLLETKLRNYLVKPHQHKALGYPVESEHHPGKALIYPSFPSNQLFRDARSSDSGSSGSDDPDDDASPAHQTYLGEERKCARCSHKFFVLRDKYVASDLCVYHWGKLQRYKGYTCCNRPEGAEGCSSSKMHVWNGLHKGVNGPLDGFVVTKARRPPAGGFGAYAVDCEMCYTMQGLELCKVSVVGMDSKTVYESYVKPSSPIVDYNTRYSGITPKHIQNNSQVKTLVQVQKDILEFVSADTILIGHGLENDLRALKMLHGTVVDTAIAFAHPWGLPYRSSLRYLVSSRLKKEVQVASHDSNEDARACVQLMLHKLACDFNHFPRSL